jgi:hypothetical protein
MARREMRKFCARGGRGGKKDGGWFYSPTSYFIGQGRSMTMDSEGNLIIVENDTGCVRKIDFHRLTP